MDEIASRPDSELPVIPVLWGGRHGTGGLAAAEPERFGAILDAGRAHYGGAAMALGNRLSRHWLTRNANPYLDEIEALAGLAGRPGVHLLNMSYEWTCTSAAVPDPGGGARLLRTLDWPLDGLGRNIVVAHMQGPAGAYENVTWPGFTGVATAMAPGRFAAALNQPPMRRWTSSCWLDWVVNRARVWRRRALPPVHLLRQVFDSCKTYDEAKARLVETPLAMPAFFTVVGTAAEQGCVIERTEDAAFVRDAPAVAANHWVAAPLGGRHRGVDSAGRHKQMEARHGDAGASGPFDWVTAPILIPTTRLAVVANPRTGRLAVRGWEADGPATQVLELA